jgi:anti-sigma factor RsiW
MMDTLHLDTEIQDLLDGRLEGAERERVEAHLASCLRCHATLDAIAVVRAASSRALKTREVPGQVVAGIAATLDREASGVHRRRAFLAAVAAVLAATVGLVVLLRRPDLPERAARDFGKVSRGTLTLDLRTDQPLRLETFFAQRRIPFRTRVLDLGMMQYRLVGGRVHTLGGKPSALFVYRGPGDRLLVCEMLAGTLADLKGDGRRFEHGGIEFLAYRREGSTQVFWQEGDVLCVLVSDAPFDEVVALAFAKAMKA